MPTLFDPVRLGDIALANRLVMAPLTRNRAPQQTPTALQVEYYRQRASAGLLITEATQIRPDGQGYFDTPGIHTPEQVAAWKRVTDAVHAEGGKIVVQLWHVGRISVKRLQPGGQAPVSSTPRAAKTRTYAAHGELVPTDEPRALQTDELPQLIADYAQAAKNAIAAGFDGVQVHAANGYLLEQFMRDSANDRSDAYGGSMENRARLLIEVMTGHYFLRPGEMILDASASADKEMVAIEGASHVFTPCVPCGATPTQFGDTVKRVFDHLDGWLAKRF